jgi:hypothetical protein
MMLTEFSDIDQLGATRDRFQLALLHGDVSLDLVDVLAASDIPIIYWLTQAPLPAQARPQVSGGGATEELSDWIPVGHCLAQAHAVILPNATIGDRLRREVGLQLPVAERIHALSDQRAELAALDLRSPVLALTSSQLPGDAVHRATMKLRSWQGPKAFSTIGAFLEGNPDVDAFLDAYEDAHLLLLRTDPQKTREDEIETAMASAIATARCPRNMSSAPAGLFIAAPEIEPFFQGTGSRLSIDRIVSFLVDQLAWAESRRLGASGMEIAMIGQAFRASTATTFVHVKTDLPRVRHRPPEPFVAEAPSSPETPKNYRSWSRHLLSGYPLKAAGREQLDDLRRQAGAAERLIEEWNLSAVPSAARRDFVGAGLGRIDDLEQLVELRDKQLIALRAQLHQSTSMVEYLEQRIAESSSSERTARPDAIAMALRHSEEALR